MIYWVLHLAAWASRVSSVATDDFHCIFKMKLYKYEIRLNLPGRQDIWAQILLMLTICFFLVGISQTHWMASQRLGESIIPKEGELKRIGPFSISTFAVRAGTDVLFSNPNIASQYHDNIFSLDIKRDDLFKIIRKYKKQNVAYLLIYEKNPIRQIWGVEVEGITLLSYKRAAFDYAEENSNAYGLFWCSISFAIWFVATIFEVRQVPKQSKKSKNHHETKYIHAKY